ncbi:MAG: S9 family peptidase [Bacteroidota bacterium]
MTNNNVKLLICLLLFTGLTKAQDKKAMSLTDRLDVPDIEEARLSPDGKHVVYTLSVADWKANKQISHIWQIGTDGSGLVQLTNFPEGEYDPVWSPDGKSIGFISESESGNKSQVFILPVKIGEAKQLTNHQTSVKEIEWSPEGQYIYFLAPDPVPAEKQARIKNKDDIFGLEKDYEQEHLWRIKIDDGSKMRVTQGNYSVLSFKLSYDGSMIAYTRSNSPVRDERDKREVWIMNRDGTINRQITVNNVPESSPMLSPDKTKVLFIADVNEDFKYYYNGNLFVGTIETGHIEMEAPDFPYDIEDASWSADGKTIYIIANMGVRSELFAYNPETGKFDQLTDGKHTVAFWSYRPEPGLHLMSIEDERNNGDLYLLSDEKESAPKRVTHVYDYLSEEFLLPRLEKIKWKSNDGSTVEGLLYYPVNYKEGIKYPLVVQTHGGPRSSDQYGLGRWRVYIPTLAQMGYMVLAPNYRGSTGYGDEFLRDMVGHYFHNSHLDVMSGVDHLISRGLVDENRMIKMGWSAGGHMTNKIITFTDRFRAASSGAGAVNWISMYGQSDTRQQRTTWFNGTPWQGNAPIDNYWRSSPLSEIFKVTTPTIIFVGENDIRVPASQSIELYRALKANGVPTELYIAPREPHGWRELRHRLFKMNAELAWFEKYALEREYTWEKAPE